MQSSNDGRSHDISTSALGDMKEMEMYDIYVFLNRALIKAASRQNKKYDMLTVTELIKLDYSRVVEELSRPDSFISKWVDICIEKTI